MKFIRSKIFQLIILIAIFLILSDEANSAKPKPKGKNNHKPKPKVPMTGARSQANVKLAKNKCNSLCSKDKANFQKKYNKSKKRKPFEMKENLFVRKRDYNTEFYVCQCFYTNSKIPLYRSYYFANKNNLKLWFKGDLDGKVVYNRNFAGKKMKMIGYMKIN